MKQYAKEYDVFISCKSEDYVYAEEVYDFLVKNHIKAFLASKELRRMGDSDYFEAISYALDCATHCIVVASKADYVQSKWVKHEWSTFINELLNDNKEGGQIITILKDVDVKTLNINLRNRQSFPFESYKDQILDYIQTPGSIKRKEEALQKSQEQVTGNDVEHNLEYPEGTLLGNERQLERVLERTREWILHSKK